MSEVVDPGGAGDRLSLNAWIAADADADAIVTTSDNSADTTGINIDFGSAFTVTAQAGDEAQKDGWKTDRYRLEVADLAARVSEAGTFTGVQIKVTAGANNDRVVILDTALEATDVVNFNECRLHSDNTGEHTGAQIVYLLDGILKTKNSLYVREDSFAGSSVINTTAATSAYVYNCTLYRGNDSIDHDSSGTMIVRNIAIVDSNDDVGTAPDTMDSCLGEDGDGTNSQVFLDSDWTKEFVAPSTFDFTLLTGGNGESNGANLSADGDLSFTDDIDGDTRSDWDIGVDEIAAAASGRIMSSMARHGGLAGFGGIAGKGGGLAG